MVNWGDGEFISSLTENFILWGKCKVFFMGMLDNWSFDGTKSFKL